MDKSHTPPNKTASATFNLTMSHNWCRHRWFYVSCHSHLQNTKNQKTTYSIVHLHFFFYHFLYLIAQFLYLQTINYISTAQYSDKGDNSLLHLIYGDAVLLTEASRPSVVLESHTWMLVFFSFHLFVNGRVYFWSNVIRSSSEQSVSQWK